MFELEQVSRRFGGTQALYPLDLHVPEGRTTVLLGPSGQPILTGIRLDDTSLILQGAVPAAVLALLVSGLFELVERLVVPRGLRL